MKGNVTILSATSQPVFCNRTRVSTETQDKQQYCVYIFGPEICMEAVDGVGKKPKLGWIPKVI